MKTLKAKRTIFFTVIGAATFGALQVPAHAQDQGRRSGLEEVLVEATKRTENVLEIPLAITAISAESLEKADIKSTQEVVRLSPSLTFSEGAHKQNSSFSIRGIGTSVFGLGVEPSVAVVIDDVASVQPGQMIAGLVDIERVEVLRGPQSTLFGKSASAGAINIVTKAPSSKPEGSIELTATDDHERRVVGIVSSPITDTLGFRLSGLWSDRDGFVENLTPGKGDKNGDKMENVRGKLRWEFSTNAVVDLALYYIEDETTCCARTWRKLDPNAQLLGFIPYAVAPGIQPGADNLKVRADGGPNSNSRTRGANVRFNVDVGEYTFSSISAFDRWDYHNVSEDVDFSDNDVQGALTGGLLHGGWTSGGTIQTDFFSQELRLVSPLFDDYEYLVGAYYFKQTSKEYLLRNMLIAPAELDTKTETESLSVFGQLTWHFTDATSATGGLRWTKEDIYGFAFDHLKPTDPMAEGDASDSPVVGKISLQHKLDENTLLYVSYARGYKGQAFDVNSNFDARKAANPVEAEHSDAYEIGVKTTVFDRRLQLSADVFKTLYKNFQVQRLELVNGVSELSINNVGELDTQGVELEAVGLLTDDLTLSFNAAYIDAVVNDYVGAACYPGQTLAQGCMPLGSGFVQTVNNGRLMGSPKWKFATSLDYQIPLPSLPFDGFANALYTWQDSSIYDINQNPRLEQGAYGIANLRVGINDRDDRYRVTLFVNNLFDKAYSSSMADISSFYNGATATFQTQTRESERYWGVSALFKF